MQRTDRIILFAATVLSAVAALLGAGWLTDRLPGFYLGPLDALVVPLLGEGGTVVLHTVLALVGVATGLAAATGLLGRQALVAGAAVQVAGFGLALSGMGTLVMVGYLVGLAVPVALLVVLVQVVRRESRARWTIGVPGLAVVVLGGILGAEPLAATLRPVLHAFAEQAAESATLLLLLALALLWTTALVRALPGSPQLARAGSWVLRHRRALTIVAATGPLPYALLRLTWLTPWPMLAPADLPLNARIWGLVLSSGAWIGAALTLGLIRPWGETFPRWVPLAGGRRVPVAAAAVPGGIAAATLIFAALPMLTAFADGSSGLFLLSAIAFPCWYWGPALALAVWGYVLHRRASDGGGLRSAPTVTAGDGWQRAADAARMTA